MEYHAEKTRCLPVPPKSEKKVRCSWILLVCCLPAVSCQAAPEPPEESIQGVWRRVESRRIQSGEETVDSNPGPSLYIFTDGHYSIVSLRTSGPQAGSTIPWQPTEEEKCSRYDAFSVNSGTYEIVNSALVTHPIVARAADFVGGMARYQYRLSGDTLWLRMVDESSPDGVQAPWVGTRTSESKLVRIE